MAEASLKGLYTVRAVKVQHLVELLSEVVEIGKSIPVAVAKKGFRTKGVSVHKGQPIRIISQGDRTWQGTQLDCNPNRSRGCLPVCGSCYV